MRSVTRTMLAVLALLSVSFQLRPRNESEDVSDLAEELLGQPSIHRIAITIAESQLDSLKQKPRKCVPGMVAMAGFSCPRAAIHLKGSFGSFQPVDQKPSFTLDFTRFGGTIGFRGLQKIHLNNSAEDPSFLNELVGADCFRAVGIPTPRVSYALVELNGRKLGLYVLKEGFTRDFLRRNFDNADGTLYETDREIQKEHIDLDRFLTFIAMEVLICHRDGYCLAGNNFRIYLDSARRQTTFLPAGMDQVFGKPDYPLELSMTGEVARTVISSPAGKLGFLSKLRDLYSVCEPSRLNGQIDSTLALLKRELPRRDFGSIKTAAGDLKARISRRYQFLENKLEPASLEGPVLATANNIKPD